MRLGRRGDRARAGSHADEHLDLGGLVGDAMGRFGMEVRTGETVEGIEVDRSRRARAVVTDRATLPADVVVLGMGVRPTVERAEAAGPEIGVSGAIAVDRLMATNIPGVWAAGDCAEKRRVVSGRPVAIALGTHANKEGRVARAHIAGGEASFPGVLGRAVAKVCSLEVARSGLGETEATAGGIDAVAVATESTTWAGYYPGGRPIRVKLVAEAGSGRLLCVQIVDEGGAAKRIDVAAMAIRHHMTVEELSPHDRRGDRQCRSVVRLAVLSPPGPDPHRCPTDRRGPARHHGVRAEPFRAACRRGRLLPAAALTEAACRRVPGRPRCSRPCGWRLR